MRENYVLSVKTNESENILTSDFLFYFIGDQKFDPELRRSNKSFAKRPILQVCV